MRPQSGVSGLEARLKALEEKQARTDALLGVTSTSGTSSGLGGGGGLGAGFNFDNETLGELTGHVDPVIIPPGESVQDYFNIANPITWTKVKSDYGVEVNDGLIQFPSDGWFRVILEIRPVYSVRKDRELVAAVFVHVLDGGNLNGYLSPVLAFSIEESLPSTTSVDGGGNSVVIGAGPMVIDTGKTPPVRFDVTASVYRMFEG